VNTLNNILTKLLLIRMSESVEEYLEAIYHFNEKGELAKNNEIAERLNASQKRA
jgi:Mn-dependent DtxR family transcriptional regulator